MTVKGRGTLRVRWKALARRAAQMQGQVIFFLLYFVAFVPLAFIRRAATSASNHTPPRWMDRPPAADDLLSARRQY